MSTEPSIRKAIPEVYNRGQQMVDDLLEDMNDEEVAVSDKALDAARELGGALAAGLALELW